MMQKILNSNKIAIGIFLLVLIYTLLVGFGSCIVYQKLTFDTQELLTWTYLSTTKYSIYGDYYYPYGLLNYLKNVNILFAITSLLVTPILFSIIFIFLQKIWKSTTIALLVFITFFLFVITITGLAGFSRYGIILVVGLMYAMFFVDKKRLTNKILFIVGLMDGIIFSLVYDQGVYAIILFLVCLCLDPLIKGNIHVLAKKSYYIQRCIKVLFFAAGLIIATLPFIIFLYLTDSMWGFLLNFTAVSDLAKYAKTPFLHSITSIANIFNILTIILALIIVVWKMFSGKFKNDLNLYAVVVILIIQLILEQKNIIRSIDTQITFVSYFLAILLLDNLFQYFKKNKISLRFFILYYCLFFISCIVIFGANEPINLLKSVEGKIVQDKPLIWNLDVKKNTSLCVDENIKNAHTIHPEYSTVVNYLNKNKKHNGKMYSFPGEPIFYILLKQKPPYYSALYESSPLYAQNQTMEYIDEQKIEYVVYNYKNFAIQDNVPNYIRGAILHTYLLKNFYPKQVVGDYLILVRDKNKNDFFQNNLVNELHDFKTSLLHVDLMSIPKSEGIHKGKYLLNPSVNDVYPPSSLPALNSFLKKKNIYSQNTFLIISDNKSQPSISKISIKVKEGLVTTIRFNSCDAEIPCIINLSRIPLFYKNRQIDSISSLPNANITIRIVNNSDTSVFW